MERNCDCVLLLLLLIKLALLQIISLLSGTSVLVNDMTALNGTLSGLESTLKVQSVVSSGGNTFTNPTAATMAALAGAAAQQISAVRSGHVDPHDLFITQARLCVLYAHVLCTCYVWCMLNSRNITLQNESVRVNT
jgi:hypothetical protein